MVAAGLALALVAASCGSDTAPTAAASGTTAPAASAPAPESSGALDLEAATADGGTVNLAEYAGEDVMLWFWAPW